MQYLITMKTIGNFFFSLSLNQAHEDIVFALIHAGDVVSTLFQCVRPERPDPGQCFIPRTEFGLAAWVTEDEMGLGECFPL